MTQDSESNPNEGQDTDSSGKMMQPYRPIMGTWLQYCQRMNDGAVKAMRAAGHTDWVHEAEKELAKRRGKSEKQRHEQLVLAKVFVRSLLATKRITGRDILREVADRYGLTVRDLVGKRRHRDLVAPRHEAMYLMTKYTKLSYPQIGKIMERDHTTVLHGVLKHAVINDLPHKGRVSGEKYRKLYLKIHGCEPGERKLNGKEAD